MTWNRVRSLLVVSCIAAFVTVGCGQGAPLSSAGSPGTIIGPTALTSDAEFDVAATSSSADATFGTLHKGDDDKGRGRGRGRGRSGGDDDTEVANDHDDEDDDDAPSQPNKGHRGSLSGFVSAVTGTTLTVRNVVVTVTPDTVIRHGHRILSMSDIHVGDKVQVKGTATVGETETTFTATEIKVEDMDHEGDDDADADGDAKVEGKIAGLTGTTTCPALTFDVVSEGETAGTTTTTRVTTNNLTKFDDVLCTALANDQDVEVKGTTQTDGSILASKIELED